MNEPDASDLETPPTLPEFPSKNKPYYDIANRKHIRKFDLLSQQRLMRVNRLVFEIEGARGSKNTTQEVQLSIPKGSIDGVVRDANYVTASVVGYRASYFKDDHHIKDFAAFAFPNRIAPEPGDDSRLLVFIGLAFRLRDSNGDDIFYGAIDVDVHFYGPQIA